ncbi:MAG TPA: efflux RND transporter periplasmic adaptor subunit [Myxococcaceae bacterium]|nr:efflux RND transporter periplasmic adaptor subunit [Myxococcaceae bacterium]
MPEPDAPHPGRRRWLWVTALVLLVGAGLLTWRVLRRPPPLQYQTAAVVKGPVVAKVTATGILSAVVTVQVGSQVSGRIARLHADYNSTVKKGQLIAEIDPALFEANLAQAKANVLAGEGQLKQAEATVLAARRTYDRDKPLRASNLIAQADLDTAETTLQAAEAAVVAARGQLAQARAQLTQSEVNLAYTKIASPIDGTVISRSVDVGQTVAASLQAPTIFTLAGDLRQMQVDTSVAEADVGKLAAGMEATFVVDAFPEERFKGTIRQIRNSPQTQQNVVTYDAVIDVQNPDLKLRPGMTANVTVVYANREEVLRVPNAALRFRPPPEMLAALGRASSAPQRTAGRDGGRGPPQAASGGGNGRSLWVLRDGRPAAAQVTVGVSDGTFSEILSGSVQAGDAVVTGVETTGRAAPAPAAPPGGAVRRPF